MFNRSSPEKPRFRGRARWGGWIVRPLLGVALLTGLGNLAGGVTYLTTEQALALVFEDPASARRHVLTLDPAHRKAIEEKLEEKIDRREVVAFTGKLKSTGSPGVAMFDAVIGKHELIDYLVALDHAGKVRFIEILAYRESYGGTIRNQGWRDQFAGRSPKDPPDHGKNIINISGATLSCRHVTEGVRKLLAIAAAYADELGIPAEK